MTKTLLLAGFIWIAAGCPAQGIVRGKVTDNTGETVPGAAIVDKDNTSLGAYTDFDGNYSINIPDAIPHILVLHYLGYKSIEITVNPKDDEVVIANFDLVPEDFIVAGVDVVGKATKSNDHYMEKMKKKSATIFDYVSSETIKRTGDPNVSSAIKRVTGVSTVGNFVTVRGLADRYIKTTINGSRIPTLDPFTNNIRLDIFPSGLVDNLVITKSATPDLPGDWSGAFLSVETKDFPDELQIEVSTSFGYNTQSSFREIISSEKSQTDWLGFDNGFRDVPTGVPTSQSDFPNAVNNPSYYTQFEALGLSDYLNTYGITDNSNINEGDAFYQFAMVELGLMGPAQFNNTVSVNNAISQYNNQYSDTFFPLFNSQLAEYGQQFNNTWFTTTRKAPLANSNSFSIGNQTTLFGKKLGYIVGLRYSNSINYDGNSMVSRTTSSPATGSSEGGGVAPTADQLSLDQQQSVETNGWSALANFAYQINPNHSVSFLFMPNITGENQSRKSIGRDGVTSPQETLYGEDQQYEERQQLVYQLKSEHFFPKSKSRIEFNTSFTNGDRNILDFKDLQYVYDSFDSVFQIQSTFTPDRRYRYMNETLFDSRIAYELPIGKKETHETKLKFGGSYMENVRTNQQVVYTLQGAGGTIITGNLSEIFSVDRFSIDGLQAFDLYYSNASSELDSDIGISKVYAGFAMADHHFGKKLRLVGGVRMEVTDMIADIQTYHDQNLPVDDPGRRNIGGVKANPGIVDTIHVLPSANLIYNLAEKENIIVNLRLNYFRSLGRPGFRELSAVSLEDYELRARVQGNPNLEMTNINNFDFRIESYFQTGDNVSFSVFYKTFENHIELVKLSGGENFTWQNADNSSALGLELEGRKQLTNNFDLRANLSLIQSEATVLEPVEETRAMFGQAPYIVNGILTYTGDSARFTCSASYNVQGARIAAVANAGQDVPDIYELPRHMVDFTLSKKFGKHYNVGFQVRNILNAPIRRSYKFDAGWLLDFDKYTYGTNYVLSVSYKL